VAGKTILIVEDDGILAIHLKKTLSGFGYTSFASVATGEEAVEIVKNGIPDLILMDIELAGEINGIDTAEIIRSFSDVPVVFLTGYSQEHLIQQAKFTAPAAYLIKPVHAPELHANIEMALYRHTLDRRVKESEDLHKSIDASLRFRNVYHEKRISLSPFNCQDPREIPCLPSHIPENIGRSLAFIEKKPDLTDTPGPDCPASMHEQVSFLPDFQKAYRRHAHAVRYYYAPQKSGNPFTTERLENL